MCIDRRKFLVQSIQSLGGLLLFPILPGILRTPRAGADQIESPHFMVMMMIREGLDATLGLDPQIMPEGADENDLFLEYRPDDILQKSGLRLGPAAHPLKDFADSCAIVNGVMMRRDAGHDQLRIYAASGDPSGKAASFAVELSAARNGSPLGLISAGDNHILSRYFGNRNILVSSALSLVSDSKEPNAEDLRSASDDSDPDPNSDLRRARESYLQLISMQPALRQRLAQITQDPNPTAAQTLAAAFTIGASREALIEMKKLPYIDSHSNHERLHLESQTKAWQQVAGVFGTFKGVEFMGRTLFDFTTFYVVTEFSRTPGLNTQKGKDHNPFTNSVLLAGKGINGGKIFGESRVITRNKSLNGLSQHIAAPFDFEKKRLAQSREEAKGYIYPENVIRTLADIFENPSSITSVSSSIPPIPGLKKS